MNNKLSFDQLPNAVFELYEKLNNIENLLLNKSPQQEKDELLTIRQASELIKLSVPTLYGYVSRNEIPFSKRPNSKRLWFSKVELTAWLLEGRKETIAETTAKANTFLKKKKV